MKALWFVVLVCASGVAQRTLAGETAETGSPALRGRALIEELHDFPSPPAPDANGLGALGSRGWLLPKLDAGPPRRGLGEWDRAERELFWSYAALSAVDAYQTMRRPDGFREVNPLLAGWAGEHPGVAETALFKAATTYGVYRLVRRFTTSGPRRRTLLRILNGLQLTVVLHNERVTDGIVLP